mmetsp:Transcript_15729/g.41459  ORF Transcript_15729/g.41459 Transcript_15729/m.41459 type:complete len:214 (+) Transcript_15729:2156-2797(+)
MARALSSGGYMNERPLNKAASDRTWKGCCCCGGGGGGDCSCCSLPLSLLCLFLLPPALSPCSSLLSIAPAGSATCDAVVVIAACFCASSSSSCFAFSCKYFCRCSSRNSCSCCSCCCARSSSCEPRCPFPRCRRCCCRPCLGSLSSSLCKLALHATSSPPPSTPSESSTSPDESSPPTSTALEGPGSPSAASPAAIRLHGGGSSSKPGLHAPS